MNNEIATMLDNLKSNIQAVLDYRNPNSFLCDRTPTGNYLKDNRTVGFHVPKDFVNYTMFVDHLKDKSIETFIVFPNLDGWCALKDTISNDDKYALKVFDKDENNLIDIYRIGSKQWEHYISVLKIDPNTNKIIVLNGTHFKENDIIKETPRGFSFYLKAEKNNFTLKKLLASYLGNVVTYSEIDARIKSNSALIPTLDKTSAKPKINNIIIYDSYRFFDKIRKTKFYDWLAMQANADTSVILIN